VESTCRWCREPIALCEEFCSNFCEESHAYFENSGDEEPEDCAKPSNTCEGCAYEFYGKETERFCSNDCAYIYGGMVKDEETGEETMREEEMKPVNFGSGKTYKEQVHDEDFKFLSVVTVQPDGTLREIGSTKHRNKNRKYFHTQVFSSWEQWRTFCRSNMMTR
jgi:hypothetical protein